MSAIKVVASTPKWFPWKLRDRFEKYFASWGGNWKCLHIAAWNAWSYRCWLSVPAGGRVFAVSISWVDESIHASREFSPVGVRPKGVCLSGHQHAGDLLRKWDLTDTLCCTKPSSINVAKFNLQPCPNCFSLAVPAVSLLLTGTGLHNLLCKHFPELSLDNDYDSAAVSLLGWIWVCP